MLQSRSGLRRLNKPIHNWLVENRPDLLERFFKKRTPIGYWTLNRCKTEASKYETRLQWQKASSGSYDKAKERKWLDLCCGHMKKIKNPKGYWTKEKCMELAKQYKSKVEWQKSNPASVSAAHRLRCYRECCFCLGSQNA